MRVEMFATGLIACLCAATQGQTIFETGFESNETPPYVPGDLAGQNGWMVTPASTSAEVQSEIVRFRL